MTTHTQGAAALLAGLALVLAGCGANPSDEATVAAPVPAESAGATDPAPSPAAADIYGDSATNDRGNVVKAIGQLAGLHNAQDQPLVQFTVTGITPGFACTSEYASPSANGNFVAIDLDVTTTAELAAEIVPSFSLSSYDFKVISPDGTTENDSIGNGYMCLADNEQLPTSLGPGEHATGRIVLDTAQTTGSIVLALGGSNGWEWGF